MEKLSHAQKRARTRLLENWPEAIALAHALNDCVTLDLYTMMEIAKAAGLSTFAEVNAATAQVIPQTIVWKDRAERLVFRDRAKAFNRAMKQYGHRGAALDGLLVSFSKEMPPADWHWRVLLGDDGRIYDANVGIEEAERPEAAGVKCKPGASSNLH